MEPKFIEMAKTIFNSIDHYRESGRDDKFNIDSIAEYLQRQFLLQQTDCYTALELLRQMYNESTELAKQGFESWQELQMNSDTENALLRVMRLIKKRQANDA